MASPNTSAVVSAESNAMSEYQRNAFAAQELLVEINPRFTMGTLECIGGTYGPFLPNYPMDVPLWLALYLRETNMCTITPPAELTVDVLSGMVEKEQAGDNVFESVPYYFFDVGRQLLRYAAPDIPDSVEVHRLLLELEGVRRHKVSKSISFVEKIEFPPPALYFSAFAAPEVEYLRVNLLNAVNDGAELHRAVSATAPAPVQRPSTVSRPSGSGVQDDSQNITTTTLDTTVQHTSGISAPAAEQDSGPTVSSDQAAPAVPAAARRRRTLRQR